MKCVLLLYPRFHHSLLFCLAEQISDFQCRRVRGAVPILISSDSQALAAGQCMGLFCVIHCNTHTHTHTHTYRLHLFSLYFQHTHTHIRSLSNSNTHMFSLYFTHTHTFQTHTYAHLCSFYMYLTHPHPLPCKRTLQDWGIDAVQTEPAWICLISVFVSPESSRIVQRRRVYLRPLASFQSHQSLIGCRNHSGPLFRIFVYSHVIDPSVPPPGGRDSPGPERSGLFFPQRCVMPGTQA